jgi:hypothetical protein
VADAGAKFEFGKKKKTSRLAISFVRQRFLHGDCAKLL